MDYYKSLYGMTRIGYSINDLDNMIPYEFELFVSMINEERGNKSKDTRYDADSTF